jgi:hypothetical protein
VNGAAAKEHGTLVQVGTISVDPPNIAAAAAGTVDVTIPGVAVGDIVMMQPPETYGQTGGVAGDDHIVFMGAAVQAANTVRISLANVYDAGEAQDAPALDWSYIWIDLT